MNENYEQFRCSLKHQLSRFVLWNGHFYYIADFMHAITEANACFIALREPERREDAGSWDSFLGEGVPRVSQQFDAEAEQLSQCGARISEAISATCRGKALPIDHVLDRLHQMGLYA